MRLFIGLDIEEAIRERIQRFIQGVLECAPNARWLRPESLHVTLKFIGEKPSPLLEGIKQALFQVHTDVFFGSASSLAPNWPAWPKRLTRRCLPLV